MKHTRKKTQTSSFGTTGRISHDSSRFYNSRLYEQPARLTSHLKSENHVPPEQLDRIFCKSSAGPSTAWGSWKLATNPTLRDVHEYVLVFSKGDFAQKGKGKKNTIGRDEFLQSTRSIWTFGAESARRIGHPAPFAVELSRRLIQLYSFEGDVVLDAFAGSGSTCIAAIETKRHFVGYEKSTAYVALPDRRIEEARRRSLQTRSRHID